MHRSATHSVSATALLNHVNVETKRALLAPAIDPMVVFPSLVLSATHRIGGPLAILQRCFNEGLRLTG